MSDQQTHSLPALRKDIEVTEGQRMRDGTPSWLIHDPIRNRFLNVGWLEFEMLKRWPLRNAEDITDAILDQTALDVVGEDVLAFSEFLKENDLIQPSSSMDSQMLAGRARAKRTLVEKKGMQRRIFIRIPLFRPDRFLDATLPVARILTSKPALYLLALVALVSLYLVIRQWDTFANAFRGIISFESAPMMMGALVITKCFHELGHAWAAKHYGLSVPSMGIAFFTVWPFLYTDTTAAWRLRNRRQRVVIGSAGMAAELYIAIVATCLWSFLPDGVLRSVVFFVGTASWIMTIIVNANPFMRWDGYYILSDGIQIENLHGRSFAFGRWKLRELLFGLGDPEPENQSPGMRRFLIGYAWCTWLYRVFLFVGMALLAYAYLFKVLGIIAMCLALTWFIAGPMFAEIKVWFESRSKMKLNLNIVVSTCLLAGIVASILYPWQRHVSAAGVVQSTSMTAIYAPSSGRLVESRITPGTMVEAGAELFSLRSDDLEYRQAVAAVQTRRYETAIARQSTEDFLEQRDLMTEKLNESRTNVDGLARQSQSLVVRAPFAGEITSVSDELSLATWIPANTPLAMLVDRTQLEVVAYVNEVQLGQLISDAPVRFFPEDPALEPVDLKIIEIGRNRVLVLPEPALAKPFGGSIDVRSAALLQPLESMFPVRLSATSETPEKFATALSRGTVRFESESTSILQSGMRHVAGVLRRESGF